MKQSSRLHLMRTAASNLPQGQPAGRGLPLGDDIPGTETFVKPLEETQEHPKRDESIYRIRDPYDRAKDQDQADERDQNRPSKTKYPYRDDKETTHNASARFVVASFLLGFAHRIARKWDEILDGLNPEFVERAKKVGVKLKRVDRKNLRWIFEVKGNNTYAVKMKVLRRGNVQDILKTDLELSCSCPAWQWQGPEFHATQEDYQLGPLQGTAASPDIRDPERQNFVCKHVAAVLDFVKDWKIPPSKGKKAPAKKAPARKKK